MGNLKKYQSKGLVSKTPKFAPDGKSPHNPDLPTQKEFDAMGGEEKEKLARANEGYYKIHSDTPSLAELQAAEAKSKKNKGAKYKEGGVKKSTASEFLAPPSVYNLDS